MPLKFNVFTGTFDYVNTSSSGGGGVLAFSTVVSPVIDGSNKTYTASVSPSGSTFITLFDASLEGVITYWEGVSYTRSGFTITFTNAIDSSYSGYTMVLGYGAASGTAGVGSINGDSTNAQTIAAGTGILVADNGTGTHTVKAINTIQTYTPSSGGTATLNLSLSNVHHITMPASGNITIALSNDTVGQCFIVRILQGAAGSQTVTFFTTIKWAGGSQPTLTTTSGKADTVGFEITGSSTYDGFVVGANI